MFELQGVYERYISAESSSHRLIILRFYCKATGATVSLLPDFAQPYRLLQSDLIEDCFFARENRFIDCWQDLLGNYRKRFVSWHVELSRVVGFALGRAPPGFFGSAVEYFKWLVGACGNSLRQVTRTLTKQLKVSTFGSYQCHLNCHEKRRGGQVLVSNN